MDLLNTCATIEKWINSCDTGEQLMLSLDLIDVFISRSRFPDENSDMIRAAKVMLFKTIDERRAFVYQIPLKN